MSDFDDAMSAMDDVLCSEDGMGEAVTLIPPGTGTVLTVYPMVKRSPPAEIDAGGKVFQPKVRIRFARNSIAAALAVDPTLQAWKVRLPLNVGGAAVDLPIRTGKIVDQDASSITFAI
jgi:hypothetical protein